MGGEEYEVGALLRSMSMLPPFTQRQRRVHTSSEGGRKQQRQEVLGESHIYHTGCRLLTLSATVVR